MNEAQRRYLRRKYAEDAAAVRCCDCPGCDTCKGFVTGCKCAESSIREALGLPEPIGHWTTLDPPEPPYEPPPGFPF